MGTPAKIDSRNFEALPAVRVEEDAEIARQLIKGWGSQGFMDYLGAKPGRIGKGFAELIIESRPELQQQYGFLHGAVVGFLADNVLAGSAGTMLGERRGSTLVLTSEYKINLLRPALGERAIARGTAVKAGRTQCVSQAHVYMATGGEETLVAVAQGTISYVEAAARN